MGQRQEMPESHVIAIDSGQTAIKVRIGSGRTYSFPGLRANSSLLPQIADVVGELARDLDGRPLRVLVGTCGLTDRDQDPEALLTLCEPHGVVSVSLAHDAITSFLGAVGNRRGVVVAAGTGAITLGVGAERIARVDGWGNVMGDAGGGYWIGREALDAAMRAHDGRGPATALTALVQQRFPDLDGAYIELQTNPDWVRTVAAFAQGVTTCAESDEVAAHICLSAGEHLAHSAATAVDRIGEAGQDNPLISLVGGIVSSGPVREACIAALAGRWPAFVPFPAEGSALDGTAALEGLSPTHPLWARVARASRP
jgi:N-acetylglucosamine kinase-like BadF-type ATPase